MGFSHTVWSSYYLTLIPITAILGNILVVLAVQKNKCLQNLTNILIASLAVADFLVSFSFYYFAINSIIV